LNRKLIALNLVLVTTLAYAVWHLRAEWRAEKVREAAELGKAEGRLQGGKGIDHQRADSAIIAESHG